MITGYFMRLLPHHGTKADLGVEAGFLYAVVATHVKVIVPFISLILLVI